MANRRTGDGYHVEPFDSARKMVAAAATVNRETNVIHLVTEADITQARLLMAGHRDRTWERLSLTAYIVTCHLVILDELTMSVLSEREIESKQVPEPIGLQNTNRKSFRQIHEELRAAQRAGDWRSEGLAPLRILVACDTKNGFTADVAEAIASILRERGCDVELRLALVKRSSISPVPADLVAGLTALSEARSRAVRSTLAV